MQASGIEILAILQGVPEHTQRYWNTHGITFPVLLDKHRIVYDHYGVDSRVTSLGQRPGLFVIDRDGIVRYAYVGRQQWDIPSVDEVLQICRHAGCLKA